MSTNILLTLVAKREAQLIGYFLKLTSYKVQKLVIKKLRIKQRCSKMEKSLLGAIKIKKSITVANKTLVLKSKKVDP
jgi:hypothetical protein